MQNPPQNEFIISLLSCKHVHFTGVTIQWQSLSNMNLLTCRGQLGQQGREVVCGSYPLP